MPKLVTAYHVEREKVMVPPPNPNLQATYEEQGPYKAVPQELYEADARAACEKWPDEWFMDEKEAKKAAATKTTEAVHEAKPGDPKADLKRGPGRPKKNDRDDEDD